MDMYLSPPDSFNLQEMLDCDIKCEMGDGFGLDCDLPPLDLEDESHHAWIHGNSNSSFELDFFGTDSTASLMVNPHTIMPLPTLQLAHQQVMKHEVSDVFKTELPSPAPSPVRSDNLDEEAEEDDDEEEEEEYEDVKPLISVSSKPMKVDPLKLTLTSGASSVNKTVSSISTNNNLTPNSVIKSEAAASPYTPSSAKSKRPVANSRKQLCLGDALLYPKPAYSYSCLIALALKNSPSGSLPVSEIYNFMCRHFPYFKSAPNGWKNSVRHNLSLNKCFEKIEKPVMGAEGGAQRKGCLWAMNPNRTAKMDDEVAKWSRKDPIAIRRSMLNPDNLELLERGELQVGWTPGDFVAGCDGDDSNEEANDECETATVTAVTSIATTTTAATTTTTAIVLPNQQQQKVAPIRIRTVAATKVRPTAIAQVLRQEVVHQQQTPTLVEEEDEDDDEEEEEVEEEEEDEEEEDEEDEEDEEEEDDGPQPIGSDESEDELSRMPPSLQPFEPRLALAKKFNEAQKELRLGVNRSQHHDIELSSDLLDTLNWTELPRFKSRSSSLLSMDVTVPVGSDYTDASYENVRTTNGRKRSAAAPIARIQGNYVCVKRKVPQICRSVK